MKKIILSLFAAGLVSIFTTDSQAQIGINLKNQKKYEREHQVGALPQKHLKKHDFRNISDKKRANETGAAEYEKTLRKENRKTARIAARHIKHPKHSAKVKRKDQVGI
jgi:hypothetical protein